MGKCPKLIFACQDHVKDAPLQACKAQPSQRRSRPAGLAGEESPCPSPCHSGGRSATCTYMLMRLSLCCVQEPQERLQVPSDWGLFLPICRQCTCFSHVTLTVKGLFRIQTPTQQNASSNSHKVSTNSLPRCCLCWATTKLPIVMRRRA